MAVYVERFYVSHNQLQLKCMSYIESILNYSENFIKALLAHFCLMGIIREKTRGSTTCYPRKFKLRSQN